MFSRPYSILGVDDSIFWAIVLFTCLNALVFKIPEIHSWHFRIVLLGQRILLEASSDDELLSTILEPGFSRIHSCYELVRFPQCALIHGRQSM